MTNKNSIIKLMLLIPNLVNFFCNVITLVGMEARAAGKSIIIMIMLSIVLAFLVTTTWLLLLAMLFVYLTSLHWSMQLSLLAILLLNVVFILLISVIISKAKKNLSFPLLSQQCRRISHLCKDHMHE